MEKGYNGWTNWETWLYALYEEDMWTSLVEDYGDYDVDKLASEMKQTAYDDIEVEKAHPFNGLFKDVLSNYIRTVNFQEVAERILSEVNANA